MAGSPLPAISHFSEEQSSELRDRIFDEFNTLAVILRAPSATFIKEAPSTLEEEEPDAPLVRPPPISHESGPSDSDQRTAQCLPSLSFLRQASTSAVLWVHLIAAGGAISPDEAHYGGCS